MSGWMRWPPPAEAQRCTCPSGDGSLRWPCPAHPPSAPVGVEDESVRVGNLPTMNQDGYPGLGEWWVQLWRGDEIIARVYGDGPDEVRSQAQDIADALNQQPAAVDSEMVTRAVNAYDEATGEGWQMPCLQGMRAALTAALRDHDQETKK